LPLFLGAAVQLIWDLEGQMSSREAVLRSIDKAIKNMRVADEMADIAFTSVGSEWRTNFQMHIEWCAANGQERQAIFFAYLRDAVWNKSNSDFNHALRQLEILRGSY